MSDSLCENTFFMLSEFTMMLLPLLDTELNETCQTWNFLRDDIDQSYCSWLRIICIHTTSDSGSIGLNCRPSQTILPFLKSAEFDFVTGKCIDCNFDCVALMIKAASLTSDPLLARASLLGGAKNRGTAIADISDITDSDDDDS